MNKLYLWQVTFQKISINSKERTAFTWVIAIKSSSQVEAVNFARKSIHSDEWQKSYLMTDVSICGELVAVEGYEIPKGQ